MKRFHPDNNVLTNMVLSIYMALKDWFRDTYMMLVRIYRSILSPWMISHCTRVSNEILQIYFERCKARQLAIPYPARETIMNLAMNLNNHEALSEEVSRRIRAKEDFYWLKTIVSPLGKPDAQASITLDIFKAIDKHNRKILGDEPDKNKITLHAIDALKILYQIGG